jgi:hypothetical protein
MHTYELAGYQWNSRGWLLRAIPYTDPELLHPEDLAWPVGINNLRVKYTAGYSTVPEAIQEATAKWVAGIYYECSRDPLLSNQLTAAGAASAWQGVPADMTALLAPHRRHTITSDQRRHLREPARRPTSPPPSTGRRNDHGRHRHRQRRHAPRGIDLRRAQHDNGQRRRCDACPESGMVWRPFTMVSSG